MLDSTKERQYDKRLTEALATEPDDETPVESDWWYLRRFLSGLPTKGNKAGQRLIIEGALRVRKRLIAAGEYRPKPSSALMAREAGE